MSIQVTLMTIIAILLLLSGTVKKESSTDPERWFVFGNQLGHVEPCGCAPETDFGGVRRLANAINQLSAHSQGQRVVLSLGDDFPVSSEMAQQAALIAQTRQIIKVDAVLYSDREIEWRLRDNRLSTTAILLSNRGDQSQSKKIELVHHVKLNKFHIYGYVGPGLAKRVKVNAVDKELMARWKKALKEANTKVLLFHGGRKELLAFAEADIFDYIYLHPDSEVCSAIPTLGKAEDNLMLPLTAAKSVFCIPRKGQGIVRGGAAMTGEVESLNLAEPSRAGKDLLDRFEPTDFTGRTQTMLKGGLISPFTWLSKNFEGDGVIKKAYAEYQQAMKAEFDSLSKSKLAALKNTPFIGPEACKACHPAAYKTWQKSSHASAYSTLVGKNKDQDPNCVTCHVLGYKDSGGFVSLNDSPQFAHVQCENCHGPRRAHSANPTIQSKVLAAATCIGCHNQEHSPKFNYDSYWPRIKHGHNF